MAINQELTGFLKEGLSRGLSREQLETALLEAGWPTDQVRVALGRFANVEFPIAVPLPRPYLFAREAFIYLVLFTALYFSAFNLGSLIFQFIQRAFPDPAFDPTMALNASRMAIRWAISLLVTAFPVFVFVSWTNERAVQRDPIRRTSRVRQWLTYLTLFVAAGVLIGDVTSIVYFLLGGEITTRFVLKALTVGVIAGAVFGYLRRSLNKDETPKKPSESVLMGGSAAVVLTAAVVGFFVLGSPSEERARRLDWRRVTHLQQISAATDIYWTRHARLPTSLDELQTEPGVRVSTNDPGGSEPYGYQPLDSTRYEVCASFDRETETIARYPAGNIWAHGSGRQCFQLEAKELDRNNSWSNPGPRSRPGPSPVDSSEAEDTESP